MRTLKFLLLALMVSALCFAGGCDDGSSSNTGDGTLSLGMTDAATDDFQAVYVTIDKVEVHMAKSDSGDGGDSGDSEDADAQARAEEGVKNQGDAEPDGQGTWKVAAEPQKTYNLLELVNGAMAELGTTDLESGRYTQIRLILGQEPDDGTNINDSSHSYPNYVITAEGKAEKLKVPSGYQTGIKLVHEFEMVAGETAELVLDFDAAKSVVEAGKSGKYILKPTIKVMDTLDYPMVKGVVTDASGEPLGDARVSAQTVDADGNTEVFTSTLTDDADESAGAYQMYLPKGNYYIVAYKDNVTDGQGNDAACGPGCKVIEADTFGDAYGADFELASSQTGDIQMEVTFAGDDSGDTTTDLEQVVTLSVLKTAACSEDGDRIEVASKTVSVTEESSTYTMSVPGGGEDGISYTVTASLDDGTSLEETVTVDAGLTAGPVTFDFSAR